jgi:hypothetical protein
MAITSQLGSVIQEHGVELSWCSARTRCRPQVGYDTMNNCPDVSIHCITGVRILHVILRLMRCQGCASRGC